MYEKIKTIQRAILQGKKKFKNFKLPIVQTSGSGRQIESHAFQLAQRFYEINFC